MAITMKPTQATIIKKNMLPLFLKELDKNKPDKKYWEECKKSKNAFTPDELEKMKRMCDDR